MFISCQTLSAVDWNSGLQSYALHSTCSLSNFTVQCVSERQIKVSSAFFIMQMQNKIKAYFKVFLLTNMPLLSFRIHILSRIFFNV